MGRPRERRLRAAAEPACARTRRRGRAHCRGRRRLFEIREIADTAIRQIGARAIDPEIFDLPLPPVQRRVPFLPPALGPVHALLLDLPTIDASAPPVLARLALFADPWPGAVAVWRSHDALTYERGDLALAPAIMGETLDPLPRGPAARWDRANRVRVKLYGGELHSVSDASLLAGANAAALRRGDGAWEVLQFANAELVGERTYDISRLRRGQAGSEWAMGDPLPAGAPFVLLDTHVIAAARGLDALGRPVQLRIVAMGRDHADPSAVALDMVPQATALRPLAPAHVKGRRTMAGIVLSWIRRTRLDGDSWEVQEPPLGEAAEAYEVDILAGASVVRTLSAASPEILYAAAHEIADFGGPQASLAVRVVQLSATVGRGIAADALIAP